ncbi:MAG: hypothetical protein M1829_004842 [Trizodia sp. TS-e1964]|nr:MAG: hypothetical protein M1829_004842 [Trizodia sp. TS-e1964]
MEGVPRHRAGRSDNPEGHAMNVPRRGRASWSEDSDDNETKIPRRIRVGWPEDAQEVIRAARVKNERALKAEDDAPGGEEKKKKEVDSPLIPFEILDAPTQRFYVFALYMALHAWRFFDWYKLVEDDADSLWLFLKWTSIDGIFLLVVLPALRIPWLEWSNLALITLFIPHAIMDGLLMFRISIPIEVWFFTLARMLYQREISVSERAVKPGAILHNASLILGKKIVHILPEGSAILNPERHSFCLDDASRGSIVLPLRINQTTPILIEIVRMDFTSNQNETIVLSASKLKALKKQADKAHSKADHSSPRTLSIQIKQTGVYRLQKVVDESKLEVRSHSSDTLIVPCPKAFVDPVDSTRCKGDLSNFALQVDGTPPLKIKYSRTVNREDRGFSFQSIQPANLSSLLVDQKNKGSLLTKEGADISWAHSQHIPVPLNESMGTIGTWLYTIDEVHDALGNVANYTPQDGDPRRTTTLVPKGHRREQLFVVHDRPVASFQLCDSQNPMKVAKGHSAYLPVNVDFSGGENEVSHTLRYLFTPLEKLQENGEHATDASVVEVEMKHVYDVPEVRKPGLYTLQAISSAFCRGEVQEPTSCLIYNPPEPDLAIESEPIHDKCAGSPIGRLVTLDLIGTPPFVVRYEVQQTGRSEIHLKTVHIDSMRHQLELKPNTAGHYIYRFKSMDDLIYQGQSLGNKGLVIEQDVKPAASAYFVHQSIKNWACIEEPLLVDVNLQGEGPWELEYELVHGGKRFKQKVEAINEPRYTITTEKLKNGGEYSLALVSVKDSSGCKIFLSDDFKVEVRRQRPKASFGEIDGKRSALALQGKTISLPLRLTGEPNWSISYRNTNEPDKVMKKNAQYSNDIILVVHEGTYEILEVRDGVCPGTVDATANTFDIKWIARPTIQVSENSVIKREGSEFVKKEVCEGDEDVAEVNFTGSPPYTVKYKQHHRATNDQVSMGVKGFTAGLGVASIRMETSKAGLYKYTFNELGDYLYDFDPKKHKELVITQLVNSNPSARFVTPGKTYKYCKTQSGSGGDDDEESIPITLEGLAPFYLEVGIKHRSVTKTEILKFPNINANKFDLRLPRSKLALGNHAISVRKVRDARGCQRKTETNASTVQVIVSDVPQISALEARADFCVGDRISFSLSGTQPFSIFYSFEGMARKATSTTNIFRRIAEKPGTFAISAVSDAASECKLKTGLTRYIHAMPSVRVSKGMVSEVDIHEGSETDILFEFTGTPPFEFTYTRSTNARKGHKSRILETKRDSSDEYAKSVKASQEGTYEVVAIKDKYCAFSTLPLEKGREGQKLVEN